MSEYAILLPVHEWWRQVRPSTGQPACHTKQPYQNNIKHANQIKNCRNLIYSKEEYRDVICQCDENKKKNYLKNYLNPWGKNQWRKIYLIFIFICPWAKMSCSASSGVRISTDVSGSSQIDSDSLSAAFIGSGTLPTGAIMCFCMEIDLFWKQCWGSGPF